MKIMRYIAICLTLMLSNASADELYCSCWFDGHRKTLLWEQGYSVKHQSIIYSESSSKKSRKQVLTGRILVVLGESKNKQIIHSIAKTYELTIIRKLGISGGTYLLEAPSVSSSLNIANEIYHKKLALQSYPDWLYINE